ncbi:MAG: T9SS type A sorting domain-containing protein [Sphingobacteriales bacterium]|nr:MAG: T9SS type A sorting domain-containing protein [Sphingobacteriales bacterium]
MGQPSISYTVPSVSGVVYNWSYSGTGVTLIGSGNSITIDVSHGATSGDLSVTATNGCGTSPARTIALNVLPYMSWTCGAGNNNWNDPANWDGGFVPYGTINVVIPASASCQPTLPASFSVRDLTVAPGVTIEVPSGEVLTITGNASIEGTVCGGYVVLSGTSAQTLTGHGTVCSLKLDNPAGAVITPGDSIHISHNYLPGDGVLTTNGGLVLLSDSLNGTATILAPVGPCTNYINGNVVVNKWIHGGRRAFRFLGHPFSVSVGLDQLTDDIDITGQGGAANGFTPTLTNNPSAFWYNTLTGNGSAVNDSTGWIPYTHTNGVGVNSWNPMQGARILVRGALGEGIGCTPCANPSSVSYDMTGPVNMCDVTVNLQTNANVGYNFVGNPYPANIDMSMITTGSAVGANFSVWDPNQGVYGAYITQPFNFSYILPAYSAFITTSSSNTNNTIQFTEAAKTASESSDNLFKTTGSAFGPGSVQLKISSHNDSLNWDRILLFTDGSATAGTDLRDAKKLTNVSLDFYTKSSDGNKLSVDFRPVISGDIIPLGLRADSQFNYTIKVTDYEVASGLQLYLKDKFLNIVQPMSEGMIYSFQVTSNPQTQGDNRFEISAGTISSVAGLDNAPGLVITPNPATDNIQVAMEGLRGKSVVTITNLIGQTIFTASTEGDNAVSLSVASLQPGVYIVTVINDNETRTARVIKN